MRGLGVNVATSPLRRGRRRGAGAARPDRCGDAIARRSPGDRWGRTLSWG